MDCSECIFAETVAISGGPQGHVQTGCHADKLKLLIDKGKADLNDDGFYELSKFCTSYRPEEWAENKEHENMQDLVEITKVELRPTFGIIIFDESNDFEDTLKTIESIKEIDYPKNKVKIVLSISQIKLNLKNKKIQDLVDIADSMTTDKRHFYFSVHKYTGQDQLRDTECFGKVSMARYFVKINAGATINPDYFKQVEQTLQEEKSIALFHEEQQDISIVPASVAKNKYLEFNNYDFMVQGIKEEAQEEGLYVNLNEK